MAALRLPAALGRLRREAASGLRTARERVPGRRGPRGPRVLQAEAVGEGSASAPGATVLRSARRGLYAREAARDWAGRAPKGGVKFGQASVKSTFAHGPHAGRTIGDVAQGLRFGRISPDSLPVEFIVRNGERVALNNRSLTALRRAGMQPTKLIDRTGVPRFEKLLDRHLGGGSPSDFIRIRGGPPGTSLIE